MVSAKVLVLMLTVGVFFHFALPVYHGNGFFSAGIRSWLYPMAAVDFIKTERLPAGIFNSYEWGGYLMWELYPDYLVFWDGRQDSMQLFGLGLLVMWGENWEAILAGHRVNTIVLQPLSDDDGGRFPLHEKLRSSPAWSLVLADDSSLVFVRRTAVSPDWLQAHELPKGRMDNTLLAFALQVSASKPWRYKAWWEMARVYMERKEYAKAYPALQQYLSRAPADKREPAAEIYYRVLAPMYDQNASGPN